MNKPLLLKPAAKDYLWGGRRLNDEFAKNINLFPLAETWECSTHPDGESVVNGGEYDGMKLSSVFEVHPEFLGKKYAGINELPILVKFIDAKEKLSVQVHPDDNYANQFENGQLGKKEMWYVMDATKDASIIYGLSRELEKERFRELTEKGLLDPYLQKIAVKRDDVFFIDSGTIHAIGAGTLVAEVQENSNLTYRIYDYDRVDKNGNRRRLDIEKALDVANLDGTDIPRQPMRVLKYRPGMASELLSRCKYFEVYRMLVNNERRQLVEYQSDDMSYRVLLCINGCGTIAYGFSETLNVYKGDCVFIPAMSETMRITGQLQFLDIRG